MVTKLDDLPDDVETLKALILAARAENARMDAERASLAHETSVLRHEVDRRLDGGIVEVDRRRRYLIPQGQDRKDCLDRACRAEQMTGG